MNEAFSFSVDLFRVSAPHLEHWKIEQARQPCWRLWWNLHAGAQVRWRDQRIALGPGRFVLVAPNTAFEARLMRPIKRHVFIHFGLGAHRWGITDRVLAVPVRPFTRQLVEALVARVPAEQRIVLAEPLLGVSLVAAVLADVTPATWNVAPSDARVQRVIAALDSHPGQSWPDAKMARIAAMSTGGFIRLFRQELGVTPQRYLGRLRLSLASSLLRQTSLSLEAIAERCGYCDRSYFSAVFSRKIGMPPARYRTGANRSD